MRTKATAFWLTGCVLLGGSRVHAETKVDYVSDPDPERYTLHVQPPVDDPALASRGVHAVAGQVNGIQFIDVYLAAGFDLSGDIGNEPSIAANPLNPNQIVVMSFSGSNWGSGGNSTLFYSTDGGLSWTRPISVPPPTGITSSANCPCDQTPDWGRDGLLYATFLHYNATGTVASVYSAQSSMPDVAGTWSYKTNAGVAKKTNDPALIYVDQPWLWSSPLDTNNGLTNVCVAYDNFNSNYTFSQTRAADSPAVNPPDFTRDAATNIDGQPFNDGMNPGNRLAGGPTGVLFNVYQRLESLPNATVKQLTYLIVASADGGQTWGAANADHPSGGKVIRASAYSFQGNGSKVGGVNALLGGVTAVNVDPASGTAWVVYGERPTTTDPDQLYLVPVTYDAGSLIVGTPHRITPVGYSYLPAVAVLPSGEVGVLFLWNNGGGTFSWRFVQTIDGGATLAKDTTLTTFTSPFANNGASNQRIFGDYVQVKSVGCEFFGTYPARGAGVNSVNGIDPYFMRAPAAAACSPPALTSLTPSAVCAGGPDFVLTLGGAQFLNGATALVQGTNRTTSYLSSMQMSTMVGAAEIASPGSLNVGLLNAAPAGGLTNTLPLGIDGSPPASPGASLRASKGGGNVSLTWTASAGARFYNVRRCTASAPCTPGTIATPPTNAYDDPVLGNHNTYWYLVDSVNGCGAVP